MLLYDKIYVGAGNMDLKNKIMSFINSKCEDDYWDFKEKWHTNNANLLHDIICLANNRVDKEAYLIIGIRDKTFDIIGVENDTNRRNQQNIIDFLNSKPFVGGIRPSIELKSINIFNHEIDIIIIKNSTDTPYFLIDDYRDSGECVHKYAIYTRIKDTNTPKDKSADINQVEFLWKKRFSLNRSPIERLFNSLIDLDNWQENCNELNTIFHNIYNPEYTITLISDDEDNDSNAEFYAYVFSSKDVYYGKITVNYFNTEIHSAYSVSLDGGRFIVPIPNWCFVNENSFSETITYKYYIVDSNDFKLFTFLNEKKNIEQEFYESRYFDAVLTFKNTKEKVNFDLYIKKNFKEIVEKIKNEEKNISIFDVYDTKKIQVIKERLSTAKILKELQENWSDDV